MYLTKSYALLWEKTVFMLRCVKEWCRVRRRLHQTISTSKWSHVITTLQTQYFISLTVSVTFVLWHFFCKGQIDFVKFTRSPPSHSFNVVWRLNNNTGCTVFSWTIICVKCECYRYTSMTCLTQKQPPLNNASPRIIYVMFFYVLSSKSGRLKALKLEFASSSSSAPCWT